MNGCLIMKKGNNVMYDKLLRALAKAINDAVEYKMKTAEFDRSYQGRVAEILGGVQMFDCDKWSRAYRQILQR